MNNRTSKEKNYIKKKKKTKENIPEQENVLNVFQEHNTHLRPQSRITNSK